MDYTKLLKDAAEVLQNADPQGFENLVNAVNQYNAQNGAGTSNAAMNGFQRSASGLPKPQEGVYGPQELINDISWGRVSGILYQQEMNQELVRRGQMKKPGKYCEGVCLGNKQECEACLKAQERFEAGLKKLERMEEKMNLSTEEAAAFNARLIRFCPSCGAPYQPNETACPSCTARYPEDRTDFEIPVSKMDRQEALLKLAEETQQCKTEMIRHVYASLNAEPGDSWFVVMNRWPQVVDLVLQENQMNGMMIQAGADHYQVPISQYLLGVSQGRYKTPTTAAREEQEKREHAARQAAINAQAEANRRDTARFQEQMNRQFGSGYHPSTKYNGGNGRVCGTCQYYYNGNQCAMDQWTNGASHSCSFWKLK